jgi:CcmD family protein
MLTFMTAYFVVWFAVLAYLIRLGAEQRRLRRIAEALRSEFDTQQRQSPQRAA